MALTTSDNPYSPVDQYEQWVQWDHEHGYYLDRYLARIYDTLLGANPTLSDDEAWALAEAEVLEHNIWGNIKYVPPGNDDDNPDTSELQYDGDGDLIYTDD